MNPRKVYEILGTDGKHWYRLLYTTAPKTAMRQLVREGWKKSQLKSIRRQSNPGTNWHVDRANMLYEMAHMTPSDKRAKQILELAHENEFAAEESRKRGMNPRKRKITRKVGLPILPIVVIGGLFWWLSRK